MKNNNNTATLSQRLRALEADRREAKAFHDSLLVARAWDEADIQTGADRIENDEQRRELEREGE
tara:strand:- start:375 stop:566 length:192 start_codon:yes stop_codon:yes gene_type:complete